MSKIASLLMVGFVAVTAVFTSVCAAEGGEKGPSTLVFIPARLKVVAFMQDVYRLRKITLVSYQGNVKSMEPSLYGWNGSVWKRTTFDDLRAGDAMPERIIVVGDASITPASVIDFSAQCENGLQIESLDTTVMASAIEKLLLLTPKEVKWLARKQSLVVTDRNAERRRYGRWGKPGSENALKSPAEIETTLPSEPDLDVKLNKEGAEKPQDAGDEDAAAVETPVEPVLDFDEPAAIPSDSSEGKTSASKGSGKKSKQVSPEDK